ncbi:hypothetical protein COP1_031039 [Malus domestica]
MARPAHGTFGYHGSSSRYHHFNFIAIELKKTSEPFAREKLPGLNLRTKTSTQLTSHFTLVCTSLLHCPKEDGSIAEQTRVAVTISEKACPCTATLESETSKWLVNQI